ncbi:thioredoxin-disulfide reductase [Desulfonatronovibrio hydrogenovorans]|uniref:thioredoxin-disulfide reductase n=1 Tax=Desulfonatronovibrio hydrogenovorans TaxID=53245 RepID=UPI00049132C1|nr:thioredoxin-disulfide reductase [Desulfonatronovibrio hydrogenovorans]
MKEYESLVIGGGPAGITAALYLLRAGIKMAWVEKLAPGGQVLLTEGIDNYPGFPDGIKGYELIDRFTAHLDPFELEKIRDEVTGINIQPGRHKVILAEGEIFAKTLIICSGAKWKKLGVPGESKFTGRGVSYCAVCDGNFFRGQDVACIGGGDTALEESLYLSKLVNKIHLIHRRDAFRGAKLYQDKVLKDPKINVIYDTIATEFIGQDDLSGIKLKNVKTSAESLLNVQGAFIFIGLNPAGGFIPEDIETDALGFIKTDPEMMTNIPGIYAAGDIRSKNCRQVSTAVGDGATAAYNAQVYLEQNS